MSELLKADLNTGKVIYALADPSLEMFPQI
jgi:hypothetical protein